MNTPDNDKFHDAALLRFVSGESPLEERQEIERWMTADPAHALEVSRLGRAWELAAEPVEAPSNRAVLWSRIEGQMREPVAAPEAPRPREKPLLLLSPPPRARWLSGSARIAAAIALVAGVGLGAREIVGRRSSDAAPPGRVYTTRPGERADLRLADGSRVVLGGASMLRIPEAPEGATRDLYLDGEAYFDVAHDSSRALRVHTRLSVARDIGTRFLISAYSSDASEMVAVAEGVVALHGSDATQSVILHANSVGRVSERGTVSAMPNVDVERYLSWMDGVIHFEDDVLEDAARVIERQYGLEIRITDTVLARRRFTGSIRATSVHADLRGLAHLLDAEYERTGSNVILRPLTQRPGPAAKEGGS